MTENNKSIEDISLFAGLTKEQRNLFGNKLQTERCKEGEKILQEGYGGFKMYILQKGRVRVTRKLGDSEIVLTEIAPTSTFGEMSLVDGKPHSATVSAISDVETLSITRDEFYRILDENSEISYIVWCNIAKELCQRIRTTTDQVRDYFAINQALCSNEQFRNFYKLFGV